MAWLGVSLEVAGGLVLTGNTGTSALGTQAPSNAVVVSAVNGAAGLGTLSAVGGNVIIPKIALNNYLFAHVVGMSTSGGIH